MLIEALISVLIFSVGVLALIGLQSVALREVSESRFRADASYIADRVLGDMSASNIASAGARAGTYSATSNPGDPWARAITNKESGLPEGSVVVAVAGDTVTVTVSWQTRGGARSFTQAARVVD
jgi:type IV pilus assembly protein PilV